MDGFAMLWSSLEFWGRLISKLFKKKKRDQS